MRFECAWKRLTLFKQPSTEKNYCDDEKTPFNFIRLHD